MSQSGVINSNEVLDISGIYEMSIFTNYSLSLPLPQIMCSNDGNTWFVYEDLEQNYKYLDKLMANYIKIVSDDTFVVNYNANLKS